MNKSVAVGLTLLAAVGYVAKAQAPDVQRYLKAKKM